ncbi:galactose mutarotase-like domain-containing protein [Fimicolochytrium jonesii]|uniref:galactose mutarotase-like domain-containing protein n=1 Tax=Fimicolochytrium jonesii TaxID=1396493 RepID=UPI0022FEBA37|nr:galactose mutarotase-like domain-containing protein [Fimicolochytrium jonesii]KAI8825147.1 galactose mutarotase-like domain-containing protein [Fimicolochytrium jonesii]
MSTQPSASAPGVTRATLTRSPHTFETFTLTTRTLTARFLNYGATLSHLLVHNPTTNKTHDIVLGFEDPADYLLNGKRDDSYPYFGATIGRVCNRVTRGQCTLNGRQVTLPVNNGPNSLHGGIEGFDKKFWTGDIVSQTPPSVRFTYTSPHGEEGYPGELAVSVTYTITESHGLSMAYTAQLTESSPADVTETAVNLTNHSYFNLSGFRTPDGATVKDHVLLLDRGSVEGVLELDDTQVPTGKVLNIADAGDAFNFNQPKKLGEGLREGLDHVERFKGYDHFFLLSQHQHPRQTVFTATASDTPIPRPLPTIHLYHPTSELHMHISTTAPGFQLYTANWLDGKYTGTKPGTQEGAVYGKHSGICFETSALVDAVNFEEWRKGVVVGRGEVWRMVTSFGFEWGV